MSSCALHGPKPATLKLGGKSPQLVFDDVRDLDRLADIVANAITGNAGQVCVAGSRLIVQHGVAEPLQQRIAARFAQRRPGTTWDDTATLPPIISASQAGRIDAIVGAALAAGGYLVCGGGLYADGPGGAYYQPTLIDRVDAANPAVQQEIFGPVLTVQRFADEDEGVALAAHEQYGLAAGGRYAPCGISPPERYGSIATDAATIS